MVAEIQLKHFVFSRGILDKNVWKNTVWVDFNKDPLSKAASLVRTSSIRSIRKAKKLKSGKLSSQASSMQKGSANRSNKFVGIYNPPKSRAPGHPLRRIFYTLSNYSTSAMIGPVGFGDTLPVPAIHEFGTEKDIQLPYRKFSRQKGSTRTSVKVKFKRVRAKYPKRAFMRPALEKNRSAYPKLWANALHSANIGKV